MIMKAKRREEISLKNKVTLILNKVFRFISWFLIFFTFILIPVLLVWAVYLTFTLADLVVLEKVLLMLVTCIAINYLTEVR